MTELGKYEMVNNAETLKELAKAIRFVTDSDGKIQGRSKVWDADTMAKYCETLTPETFYMLTRNFGIRQQAIMLYYYYHKED